ncbi:hypothetical protein [Actinoplanes sp. NPDC051411]|uniref:hypothetical protein n=1 Tax=Actinoplanes sp. NPDC051411 TaxID=3155522 RepID=UPI00341A6B97
MRARADVKYGRPQFRTTVWPGMVIPPPKLRSIADVEIVDDWILWPVQDPRRPATAELPTDFYLRELMDLQCDDLEAIKDLISKFGSFSSYKLEDLDGEATHLADSTQIELPDDDYYENGYHRSNLTVHLEEAQRAIETWIASQIEHGLEDLVEEYATEDALYEAQSALPEYQTMSDLRNHLIDERVEHMGATLNAALKIFSAGIGELSERQPTIYAVSFLQMYNHLTEQATLRRCANEPCSNVFVRQRDRADHGQNRTTGVIYCSHGCARAQAQRQLRRRRKANAAIA